MSTMYFPQLANGNIAQYPVTRTWLRTATINNLPDGSVIALASVTPARMSWTLSYSGLSQAEWSAIEGLFEGVQGQFGNFTFVDPADNLLSWSENLAMPVWTPDPLLQVATSAPDPNGGTNAVTLTNGAQASQGIVQQTAGPGWFEYTFSIYLRSDTPCSVTLIRAGGATQAQVAVAVGETWTRVQSSGALVTQGNGFECGLELDPGVTVYAYGAQLEAQPDAGAYKTKTTVSGVYPSARFDQDILVNTSDAWGQFATSLKITSAVS
jgi:hypothetical protein